MSVKEFSGPVLENPPELSRADIERVAELTDFPRDRINTALEMSARHGLGDDMKGSITRDLIVILCALYGLSRTRIEKARYVDVRF